MRAALLGLILLAACAAAPASIAPAPGAYRNPCPFGLGHIIGIEVYERRSMLLAVPDTATLVTWECVAVQGGPPVRT